MSYVHLQILQLEFFMATLSHLVAAVAEVEGIDAERVSAIARSIREAGFIRTSGRGTSAAQMSEADAANLLIATNTAETARAAPTAVMKYRALEARRGRRTYTFGDRLEELLSAAKRQVLAEYFTKAFGTQGHGLGKQAYPNEEYDFGIIFEKPTPSVYLHVRVPSTSDALIFDMRIKAKATVVGDRRETTEITGRTILAVASTLRT